MDLYTTIKNNRGQVLQDGSMWRDVVSKDRKRLIRQYALRNGNFVVDYFEKQPNGVFDVNNPIRRIIKTMKPDGKSCTIKRYNPSPDPNENILGDIRSILKLETPGSFMRTIFKIRRNNTMEKIGDFASYAEGQIETCDVNQIFGYIDSKEKKYYTSVFNKMFGKIETKL